MSDARERVREQANALGIEIADERLDQLAAAWEEVLAEAESIRQEANAWPTPSVFDASWSEKP